MHATTTLANRDYWKELQIASFKAANWDIEKLHSHIQCIEGQINASGEVISDAKMIMHLMEAYKTQPNPMWQ